MGGSGKGKQGKNKGKSKSREPEHVNKQSGTSTSDTSSGSNYLCTEKELEILLDDKLEGVYAEALRKLLALGYKEDIAQKALHMNGHGNGPTGILSNIIANSIAFIGMGCSAPQDGKVYKDLSARIQELRILVLNWMKIVNPSLNKADAIRHILAMNILEGPSTTSCVQSEDQSEGGNENKSDLSDEESILPMPGHEFNESNLEDSDFLRFVVDCPDNFPLEEWLEMKKDDPKNEMILNMVKKIGDLKGQLVEYKEWAQKRVMQVEEMVTQGRIELNLLRKEKLENKKILEMAKQEFWDDNMKKLMDMQNKVNDAYSQVDFIMQDGEKHELQISRIKADIEACKLDQSETERELRELVKREKKMLKKATTFETQREQTEEEKMMEIQFKQELIQVNNAKEEAEVRVKDSLGRFQENKKLLKATKARANREHASLCQEMEKEFQHLKDEIGRLQDDLVKLRISSEDISYDSQGGQQLCPKECVLCFENEASILLLPCGHLVFCMNCEEKETIGDRCPCCQVYIEEKVRVFGPSS